MSNTYEHFPGTELNMSNTGKAPPGKFTLRLETAQEAISYTREEPKLDCTPITSKIKHPCLIRIKMTLMKKRRGRVYLINTLGVDMLMPDT